MNETKTSKVAMRPQIRFGGAVDTASLRELATREPETFVRRVEDLIARGELRLDRVRSLHGLFDTLADIEVPARMQIGGHERTIMTGAFPLLVGGLTVAAFNEAFENEPSIGGQLVREMQDNKKFTTVAAIHPEDSAIPEVREGQEFPLIGAHGEKFQIGHLRNGRRIAITAEMFEENDVAGFITQVNQLSELANEITEVQTLRRVCDIDGSATTPKAPYVLNRNGAGVSLFRTTNTGFAGLPSTGNRITSNALVETTNLEAARARLASMLTDDGRRHVMIPMSRCTLLVPDALLATALKLTGSEYEPGIENELNNWGQRGQFRPRVLSSPRLDDLSTTVWYLGWYERQFVRKWKLMLEYVTLSGNTADFVRSRVAFEARVAWDMEVGATDYRYVVQNLSATTAP